MNSRVRIHCAVLVVAFAGMAAWQLLRDREPAYEGKRLGQWLRECRLTMSRGSDSWRAAEPQTYERCRVAVRAMGSNALPILLKMLSKKDSNLVPVWEHHVSQMNFLPRRIRYPEWYRNPAGVLNEEAAIGLQMLGPDARAAVPALIRIYEANCSPASQSAAARVLNAIGPDAQEAALHSFLAAATNPVFAVREGGVRALAGAEIRYAEVIPALSQALHDQNFAIRIIAAGGLAGFGTNARPAVPALMELLSDSNFRVRRAVTNALMNIDRDRFHAIAGY